MILEIDASVLPAPIVLDLSSKAGTSPILPAIHPSVTLRDRPGGVALASWAPHGSPTSRAPAFLAVAAVVVLFTFAAIGVAKTLK